MNKRDKIIHRVVLVLFTLPILMGVGMYLFQHDTVVDMYTELLYPTYLIYPLAAAKVLGLIAIWSNKSKTLKEWAYAGFVFELMLGASAHINVKDGGTAPAIVILILVLIGYFYDRKLSANTVED